MTRTRPFARPHTQAAHAQRASELAATADQWLNIHQFDHASACAAMSIAHMYASRMPGYVGDNPANFAECKTPKQHIGRALAAMNGGESALTRQNIPQANALAAIAVMHFVAASMFTSNETEPIPKAKP